MMGSFDQDSGEYAQAVARMFRTMIEQGKPANGPGRPGIIAWCNFVIRTREGKHIGLYRRRMPFPLPPCWRVQSRREMMAFTSPDQVPDMRPEMELTFYLQDGVSSANERVYLANEDGSIPRLRDRPAGGGS